MEEQQFLNPADAAINFILKNASKFAQAKATRVQLEEFRKSKKATSKRQGIPSASLRRSLSL